MFERDLLTHNLSRHHEECREDQLEEVMVWLGLRQEKEELSWDGMDSSLLVTLTPMSSADAPQAAQAVSKPSAVSLAVRGRE